MKLTYANVMASAAMFVALSGTSYAAVKLLPKNSVGSDQVKDHSLGAVDLAAGAIPSAAAGPRGPRGADGPTGSTGATGPSNILIARREGDTQVGFGAGASVNVATLKVPAGTWFVRGESTAIYFPNTSPSADGFYCQLVVNGVGGNIRQMFVGNQTGASHYAILDPNQTVRAAGPTTIVLHCWHDSALPSGASVPVFTHTTVVATQAGSIDDQDVTG